MATYVTKSCPHCRHTYQFMQGGSQRKYGCPYITCEKCKKSFWDNDIKEPALYSDETNPLAVGCGILFISLFSIVLLLSGLLLMLEGQIIFGIFLMGIVGLIIAVEISEIIYEKKHKDEILANRQKEYDESLLRLKNTGYLSALASYDSKAANLLKERLNEEEEHYAERPNKQL